jgi:cell division protein FtsL
MLLHSICLSVMTLILFILLILQTAKVYRLEKRIKKLEQDMEK